MQTFTPFMLDLNKKNVIIIGGGKVAERRIFILLETGANLTVISPEVTENIQMLSERGRLQWKKKAFEEDDILNAFLVVIATNNPKVNNLVHVIAPEHMLMNDATDAKRGNIHFPTTIKRGRLTISIATNGASPMLTKKIKQELESYFPEKFSEYVDFLYECRELLKKTPLSKEEQHAILKKLLEIPVPENE